MASLPDQITAHSPASNKATVRTLRLLALFLENPRGDFRVTDLCKKLDINKQTAIRSLQTLLEEGYLVKNAQGNRYELGYRIAELGHFDQAEPDLVEIAMPYMQQLHALTGATVTLAMRVGDHQLILEGIDGKWPLLAKLGRGKPMPLYLGPVSRMLLASLPDIEIQDYLARHMPLKKLTPLTITDPDLLMKDIQRSREMGIAQGEAAPGVGVVGFPIFGFDGRMHGTIGILDRIERIQSPEFQALIPSLRKLMDELNSQTRLFQSEQDAEILL